MVKGHLENVGLAAFTQLLAAERETCTLTVQAVDRAGTMRFLRGELIDAQAGSQRGEEAAIEIFGWGIANVDMGSLWHQARRTITSSLTYLLIEAMRRRDEEIRDDPDAGAPHPIPAIAASGARGAGASGTGQHPTVGGHPAQDLVAALARSIEGFIAAFAVDVATGLAVATQGNRAALDLELASSGSRDSLHHATDLLGALQVGSSLEELAFTLSDQLHIIKPSGSGIFVYLVVDRERTSYPQAKATLQQLWPAFEADVARSTPLPETSRAARA